ncbi:MAG: GTP 3',8-cyclase MoaA [Acidobacteria bacterium]|nr:GTP 3',8-cyclase MoaA [Acidobacteriota bacterium]
MSVTDLLHRPLRDLRVSVTDRCNLRCQYCMPGDRTYSFLPRHALLSFEEIHRVVVLAAECGVKKIRLTGGEPLLRKNIAHLISLIRAVERIEDLALTTNGMFFMPLADALKRAGLDRVTFSLDSLDPERLKRITLNQTSAKEVLTAIEKANELGFAPVKVNMVVQRGVNDDEICKMARVMRDLGAELRFIEYMDVGTVNGWDAKEVVTIQEILAELGKRFSFEPLPTSHGVARRFKYSNGGTFGVIASVSEPFCGGCSRLRLSSDGQLFTCLFGTKGHDLKSMLRSGCDDAEIIQAMNRWWGHRADRYSELRAQEQKQPDRVEMFRIGG